jgi:hypothetical protein
MVNAIKEYTKAHIARAGYSIRKLNELTRLADKYRSDKGTCFSAHLYTRVYERYFRSIKNDTISILEIGLLRTEEDKRRPLSAVEGATSGAASRAPSLEMWRSYFPNATLYGFDIDDFSRVNISRCKIIRGDMSSRDDLSRLSRQLDAPLDVIIEDGSHASHHQQIALGTLFPHVRSGGLYIIEDLHWQDALLEKPNAPKTKDLLNRFKVTGKFESPFLSETERAAFERNVDDLSLFDSLTLELCSDHSLLPGGDASDAIAIIRKK